MFKTEQDIERWHRCKIYYNTHTQHLIYCKYIPNLSWYYNIPNMLLPHTTLNYSSTKYIPFPSQHAPIRRHFFFFKSYQFLLIDVKCYFLQFLN